MNYERIIQWVSGPFAMVVGVVATKLVTHLSFLGQLGLQSSAVAHAIVAAVVFVVSTGVTYAAHHKWLSNLTYWWDKLDVAANPASSIYPVSGVPAPSPSAAAAVLRQQLVDAGHTPVA